MAAAGTASRTVRDRLEVLTALMQAPSFDPVFREDIIRLPRDHAVYGWGCRVPECQRSAQPHGTLCFSHQAQWREAKGKGVSYPGFVRGAEPLEMYSQVDRNPCVVCPDLPALTRRGLCYQHEKRWKWHVEGRRKYGKEPDFQTWLASCEPFPSFGPCQAPACPHLAQDPLRLCRPHMAAYRREGRPGGAAPESGWTRKLRERSEAVSYRDEAAFRSWVKSLSPIRRLDGQISLLGMRPLAKAEIQWAMFQHANVPMEGAVWPISNVQQLADHCRRQKVSSLADLDFAELPHRPATVARLSLKYLQVVYFTREETKAVGFLQTQHFGISWGPGAGCLDLTNVTQQWLRDLLWDYLAHRLITDPPRARVTIDGFRRGCAELSAFLEAQAPAGGHDPTVLTGQHMLDFVADQRHRAQHGLPPLGLLPKGSRYSRKRKSSKGAMGRFFNTARRVLRTALDNGQTNQIGLSREFVTALPSASRASGRRRPFPDDVARAVADETNLKKFESFDFEDRGLRDIWEGLVITGRRCSEVLTVRLECIGRLGGLPMFWHDQTKVGNFDEAIRISERLYARIQQRQAKTVARFFELNGRQPTAQERLEIALFPRRPANREFRKAVSYSWFNRAFHDWLETLDVAHCVPHQARHTLATNLLKNGANLTHVKRYLGQVSEAMAEHYVHLASTDPQLEEALQAVWVAGPGAPEPGLVLSGGEPMSRQQAKAMLIDLTRQSTPAEGGFCTFQPVVNGDACPWKLDCHNCDKFVLSGADLLYWHRKRQQWRTLAERAPDSATADYLHGVFEPTARAIAGLEKALDAVGLLQEALALDLRRPQDYFGRVWSTTFRAQELARAGTGEVA